MPKANTRTLSPFISGSWQSRKAFGPEHPEADRKLADHELPDRNLTPGEALMIFHRLGVIEEPSDAAWEAKRREVDARRQMH